MVGAAGQDPPLCENGPLVFSVTLIPHDLLLIKHRQFKLLKNRLKSIPDTLHILTSPVDGVVSNYLPSVWFCRFEYIPIKKISVSVVARLQTPKRTQSHVTPCEELASEVQTLMTGLHKAITWILLKVCEVNRRPRSVPAHHQLWRSFAQIHHHYSLK